MEPHIEKAIDARQAPAWGEYLRSMGWTIERIGQTQIFIHKMPLFNKSLIKIQHPLNPLPFEKLEKIAKKHNALFMIIEPHHYNYKEDDFISNGYRKTFMQFAHTATIKIDLQQSEKELLASFSENARRNIKKAQKNNLRIEEMWYKDDENDVYFKKFYSLLMLLSKSKKFYSPSIGEYHKKMNAFKDTSILLFAYEGDEKEPLAVVWYASYGDVMTYMQTGITKRGYELLANYLLVWEGLKLAKQQKVKVFDFESIFDPRYPKENKKWQGYSEFKKRFHGTLIEYPPAWIKIYSTWFRWFYLWASFFIRQ